MRFLGLDEAKSALVFVFGLVFSLTILSFGALGLLNGANFLDAGTWTGLLFLGLSLGLFFGGLAWAVKSALVIRATKQGDRRGAQSCS